MTSFLQVATTVNKRETALGIAQALVESRLAACSQVLGPLTSVYRWQGQVESAEEWLCVAKTSDELYDQVEAAIRQAHPYELPEILATPIARGSRAYLDWLRESLQPSSVAAPGQ